MWYCRANRCTNGSEGLTDAEARARVYMVDRFGLITENQPNLLDFQRKLAQKAEVVDQWGNIEEVISLLDVVKMPSLQY